MLERRRAGNGPARRSRRWTNLSQIETRSRNKTRKASVWHTFRCARRVLERSAMRAGVGDSICNSPSPYPFPASSPPTDPRLPSASASSVSVPQRPAFSPALRVNRHRPGGRSVRVSTHRTHRPCNVDHTTRVRHELLRYKRCLLTTAQNDARNAVIRIVVGMRQATFELCRTYLFPVALQLINLHLLTDLFFKLALSTLALLEAIVEPRPALGSRKRTSPDAKRYYWAQRH